MGFSFVDTSAWYAYFDNSDTDHPAAARFMNNLSSSLITTNYIIDETLTLIRTRIGHSLAVTIGKQLFAGHFAQLVRVTDKDESAAFELFTQYSDKSYSFTDCTSFVIMRNLDITQAFTFDKHFRQAGFKKLP